MNLKTGDKVVVIAGKDKGKEGIITKTLREERKVVIEGVNIIKKTIKPNGQNPGTITEMEAPIDASNVMLIDAKTKKRVRLEKRSKEETKEKKVATKKPVAKKIATKKTEKKAK